MDQLESALRVYLVADPSQITERDLVDTVARALHGGVTMVQLRAKTVTDREAMQLGREISGLCREYGAAFLVNDRIDLAFALGADGVHLGVDDLPLEDARRIVPDGFIIGYSPESDAQVDGAAVRGADYLGVGPVFGTVSKSDAGEAIGLDLLKRRVAAGGLPTIGIGGVTSANARSVIDNGACGVAVISAILRSADPEKAASLLREVVDGAIAPRNA